MIYGDPYKKREFDKYNYLISRINASPIKNFSLHSKWSFKSPNLYSKF